MAANQFENDRFKPKVSTDEWSRVRDGVHAYGDRLLEWQGKERLVKTHRALQGRPEQLIYRIGLAMNQIQARYHDSLFVCGGQGRLLSERVVAVYLGRPKQNKYPPESNKSRIIRAKNENHISHEVFQNLVKLNNFGNRVDHDDLLDLKPFEKAEIVDAAYIVSKWVLENNGPRISHNVNIQQPQLKSGTSVFLRTWLGCYIDVQGDEDNNNVRANWNEHGLWQWLRIEKCDPDASNIIKTGDRVALRAHNDKYVAVGTEEDDSFGLIANWFDPGYRVGSATNFIIENEDSTRNRTIESGDVIFLKSDAAVETGANGNYIEFNDGGIRGRTQSNTRSEGAQLVVEFARE